MKHKFFIFLFLVFISSTSAVNIFAGESTNMTLDEEFDYFSIVGNSTPIDLMVEQNGFEVTITFNKYQQEDNFELIFFNKEKEIITEVYVGGGGSRSRTIYKDRNITKYVDREVEKIVEVEDDDEINRLLGIANDAARGKNTFRILFIVAMSMIVTILIIIKTKNSGKE